MGYSFRVFQKHLGGGYFEERAQTMAWMEIYQTAQYSHPDVILSPSNAYIFATAVMGTGDFLSFEHDFPMDLIGCKYRLLDRIILEYNFLMRIPCQSIRLFKLQMNIGHKIKCKAHSIVLLSADCQGM